MSRSGYSDDGDQWDLIRWRGQVASAIRGKRGQKFLRDFIAALDAMPEKRLIRDDIRDDSGCMCSLGALGAARGLDLDSLDPYAYDEMGNTFNIASQLVQEIMYENDEGSTIHEVDGKWVRETPELRWKRMRAWAVENLKKESAPTST